MKLLDDEFKPIIATLSAEIANGEDNKKSYALQAVPSLTDITGLHLFIPPHSITISHCFFVENHRLFLTRVFCSKRQSNTQTKRVQFHLRPQLSFGLRLATILPLRQFLHHCCQSTPTRSHLLAF
ncbi:hypothetical protein BLNAU_24075 [Blattamonas nauphoetae]|uniref:Uncharacterized protein n=1 Tax=Blattamonas nauphoetae TaxID=2049346 RepID=A0ABQ9WPD8_9EUKA|nr:hypothetical protein BLNAU_24075 [Blattamonas nauphoetae]